MTYGLIGERLGHSYSREIHEALYGDGYELRELRPDEVGAFLRARDFRGINVTIPYKQTVMPYLDEIAPEARAIGAVNTVVRRGDKLVGYNTDFAGMEALSRHTGVALSGKKVLILGSGGTAHTARAVCAAGGARAVLTVSRTPQDGEISYTAARTDARDADVIINTTPVGMYPHAAACPLDISAFPALSGVLDAIYNPLRTELVQAAAARGIPASGGLYMLVMQAVYAAALFRGEAPLLDRGAEIFRRLSAEKQNIVLIGMPASGKTTVGQALAAAMGRPFLDTDAEFSRLFGCPAGEYLRRAGVESFRERESEIVAAAGARTGCVIATGGGAILREKNLRALRGNGVLVFLDRSPDRLQPTADRPLSSDRAAMAALYRERYPRYLAAADIRIPADGTVAAVTAAVQAALKERP